MELSEEKIYEIWLMGFHSGWFSGANGDENQTNVEQDEELKWLWEMDKENIIKEEMRNIE